MRLVSSDEAIVQRIQKKIANTPLYTEDHEFRSKTLTEYYTNSF